MSTGDPFVRRPFSAILLAGALMASTGCTDGERSENASDPELIQGTWGYVHPVRMRNAHHVVFDGSGMRTIETRGEKVSAFAGEYQLDPGHEPKHIDTVWTKNGVTRRVKGIYSLDGDTLKIASGPEPDRRPAAFPEKSEDPSVTVLQRVRLSAAETEALAELEKLGATCSYVYEGNSWAILKGEKFTDEDVSHLEHLTRLTMLSLSDARVTDVGLSHLKPLEKLEKVSLAGTRITDAGLPNLYGLQSLAVLNLERTQVSAEGVERIRRALPNCDIDR